MKNVSETIIEILGEGFGATVRNENDRLVEDLRMDSMDRVELVMMIEELGCLKNLPHFEGISDEEAEKWVTVADVVKTVEKVAK